MTTCKLSELISHAFAESHRAVKSGAINELVEKGGRGGAKSSFISVELVLEMLKHPDCHSVVMRKVGNTLRTSVYAEEHDLLACGQIGALHGADCTLEPAGQAQLGDGPADLRIDGGAQGVAHRSEEHTSELQSQR